jgi:ubiquinone/menaquinone biosynthesis C-methylase UbiE
MPVKERRQAPGMEGPMARWFARSRSSGGQPEQYRAQAAQLTAGLRDGADVLEVAPGPGYLAIEIARLSRFRVAALDLSRSFVEIAGENARQAGVSVDLRRGDAASMPFESESFDLVVCQAAFKSFGHPRSALDEMHRVLRPGGTAVIQDMSRHASAADIREEVRRMALNPLNALITRRVLSVLRRRAYSPAEFERLAVESAFGECEVRTEGIGLEVRLVKRATGTRQPSL